MGKTSLSSLALSVFGKLENDLILSGNQDNLLCLLHPEAVYSVVQDSGLWGQWELSSPFSCGLCFVGVVRFLDLSVLCLLICKAGLLTGLHSCREN